LAARAKPEYHAAMATLKDFSVALLDTLGLEPTKNRIISIVAFAAIEGGHWANTARFNPMNTMKDAPGAVQAQGLLNGIKAYPDWPTGIKATAATIAQKNMLPIAAALKNDADPVAFLAAVTKSAWCPGCDYTKFNPEALYVQRANIQDKAQTALVAGAQAASDWMTKWGPWILGGLALITLGGIYYVSTKPGGFKGFLGMGAREGTRRRRDNPLKRGSSRQVISANIRKLHREHPSWSQKRVVAAALNNARRTSRGPLPQYLRTG
jgi:hypothetical protein